MHPRVHTQRSAPSTRSLRELTGGLLLQLACTARVPTSACDQVAQGAREGTVARYAARPSPRGPTGRTLVDVLAPVLAYGANTANTAQDIR